MQPNESTIRGGNYKKGGTGHVRDSFWGLLGSIERAEQMQTEPTSSPSSSTTGFLTLILGISVAILRD